MGMYIVVLALDPSIGAGIVTAISVIFLIIIIIIGVAAIFRKSRVPAIVWCVIMALMFCVAAIQMILFGIDVTQGYVVPQRQKDGDDDNYLHGSGETLYWAVLILYMGLTFCGFVSGIFFWWFAKSADEAADNFYG